jgi:Tfp pilus assembly protein PilF
MERTGSVSTTSNSNNSYNRLRITYALSAIALLAIGAACNSDSEESKAAVTPAVSPQPAVAQTLDSGAIVPVVEQQPVTYASAESAYRKRNYREATEMFDRYVQDHPRNAFGHYMLGLSAWKSGDLERARNAFEQSLALDSTNVKTRLNLGRVLLDEKRPDDALVHVQAAVTLDSGSAETQRMLARVQAARGDRDAAMATYRLALSIDPADSWSMNNLGLLLIEQGRFEEALPALARAVELRPEAPAFANNLGIALERSGFPHEAADAYRSALVADSTYGKAARSLARVETVEADSMTTVDVIALAASFNEEIQKARETRLMAKAVVKPEGLR